ncbi:MAG: 30S ribosomal protein S3 [Planctomycetes bacterium]|nr:30S ribosomal protein S3 [Planctomycetota bacterium]
MGHKVVPIGIRIGIVEDWRSRWYAKKKDMGRYLLEDQWIRKFLRRFRDAKLNCNFRNAMLSRIEIERTRDQIKIKIHSGRPGLIIGRKGQNVDHVRALLEAKAGRQVLLDIVEITEPDLDAQLVCQKVAEQLEKRASFRRTMKRAAEDVTKAGAKGVKIAMAGRLAGSEMARREKTYTGSIPLSTLSAVIDYGFTEATTQYGNIGIKCWIYKGRQLKGKERYRVDAKAGEV